MVPNVSMDRRSTMYQDQQSVMRYEKTLQKRKQMPFSRKSEDSHEWTPEDQGEYVLFNTIQERKRSRRRSAIVRNKWKKAKNIINIISRFCQIIARSSIEMKAHLKTFADIGDQAATDEGESEGHMFDAAFKSKKSEPGELVLSTKVQVLMTHSPESRTTDQVTLILCDLQCFPCFCSYPLAVQNKIARNGMFQPVGKRRVIIREGHEAHNWYFVISGQAIETETEVNEDGSEVQNTIKFITQGMTFGERAIINDKPHRYTVTSRKNMQLLRLAREHFEEVQHRLHLDPDAVPEHITFMKKQPFMIYFPWEVLMKHPSMCCQYYHRPNTVLVTNSESSEWIYVIRSGSCVVQMYVDSTKASWRDLQMALSHPQVNVNGRPEPGVDTGPGKLPLRNTAYSLFQRFSAQEILASDLNQVPALHMTKGGSKNVRHGLHLLTDGAVSRIKCPWPLDFFDAMNRTAFTISLAPEEFPIEPVQKPCPENTEDFSAVPTEFANPEIAEDFSSGSKGFRSNSIRQRNRDSNKNALESRSGSLLSKTRSGLRKLSKKSLCAESGGRQGARGAHTRISFADQAVIQVPHGAHNQEDIPDQRVFLTEQAEETKHRPKRGRGLIKERQHRPLRISQNSNPESSTSGSNIIQSDESFTIQNSVQLPKKYNSCCERRKKYMVPEYCKPRRPQFLAKKEAPYDCVSPPVYIHIDYLTEGDTFGLDQLHEPGWERRDQSGRVALISRGAEVVTLNKRFFMSFADDKTHVAIREHMRIYPTCQSVQTRYRLQLAWQLYSAKIRDEFNYDVRKGQGRTHTGTFFQTAEIPIGDPYAILKE